MSWCTFLTPPLISPERVVKLRLNSIHSHSPVKDVLSFNFSTGCSCSSFPAALCVGVKGSLWTHTPLTYESASSQAAGPTACQPPGGVSEFSLLNGTDKANPSVHWDTDMGSELEPVTRLNPTGKDTWINPEAGTYSGEAASSYPQDGGLRPAAVLFLGMSSESFPGFLG